MQEFNRLFQKLDLTYDGTIVMDFVFIYFLIKKLNLIINLKIKNTEWIHHIRLSIQKIQNKYMLLQRNEI